MGEATWLTPLVLMPGIGLLIMSTSVRYGQIHGEVHHLLDEKHAVEQMLLEQLENRAMHFRNALVALYISIALFVLGALAGAIVTALHEDLPLLVLGFTVAGIACVLYAATELIRESILSLKIVQTHIDQLKQHHDL